MAQDVCDQDDRDKPKLSIGINLNMTQPKEKKKPNGFDWYIQTEVLDSLLEGIRSHCVISIVKEKAKETEMDLLKISHWEELIVDVRQHIESQNVFNDLDKMSYLISKYQPILKAERGVA